MYLEFLTPNKRTKVFIPDVSHTHITEYDGQTIVAFNDGKDGFISSQPYEELVAQIKEQCLGISLAVDTSTLMVMLDRSKTFGASIG